MTPTFRQCLAVAQSGLPPSGLAPKQVAIIGAGMAGMVAGVELARAGHQVILLEASQRVGGRVRTLRTPFSTGLYAEAGAMRIPQRHLLTLAYISRYGLETQPFTSYHPRAYFHFFGRRFRQSEPPEADWPGAPNGFAISASRVPGRWSGLIHPILETLRSRPEDQWLPCLEQYERLSTAQFLAEHDWSSGDIEAFGLLFNQEALLDNAVVEVLLEEARGAFADLVQIRGGMDRLPAAFEPELAHSTRLGARVIALEQDERCVTVRLRVGSEPQQVVADRAIVTLPFSVLRFVDVLQPFSTGKQRAIRELNYDGATKIFLECNRRFWEEDDGIFGGRSVTDLPIRTIYYPEQGSETGRGVLLAGYTWGEDAERWGALPQSQRIALASQQAARIHPQLPPTVGSSASVVWNNDSFSAGAFADFTPGQQSRLFAHIVRPEGRYHFAGEHASLAHAWIQGAIESGIRAAWEVHRAE